MTAARPSGRCDLTVFVPEPASVRGAPGVQIEPVPEGATLADVLGRATTPFAAVAGPGDRPDLERLAGLAAALALDPVPVLAFGRAEPEGEAPDPALHPWAFPLGEGAGVVDGRALADGALRNGANVIGPTAVVVVRRAAVAPGDGAAGPFGLWLELLARGPAWYDPAVAARTAADPDDIPAWPEVVDAALECGLLAADGAEVALVARLARLALGARRRLERGESALGSATLTTPVRALADALDAALNAASGRRPTAAVDVLVLADGDHALARASADAAATWAGSVTVADRSGAPLPAQHGTVTWVAADWASDDSARLLGGGDRPVLVVAAGEFPEVLDAAQLDRVAAAADRCFAAEVAAPAGPEVRLVSPGAGADARVGSRSTTRVHAVRLRSLYDDDWLAVEPSGRPEERARFVIAAPGYRRDSGGVVAMHRLCDVLNRLGHDAVLLPIDGRADTYPGWRTPIAGPAAIDGAVVVYPEIVVGNPLGADRVVRWLLNRPGEVTGGGLGAGPGDLVVAWNRAIDPDLPLLTVPLFDPRLFFPKDTPGRGGLVWLGKGRLPHGFARAGTSLVTRAWPATRRELGAALRAADVLYSCDWMTALAFEALLCGTPVVLVGEQQWSRDELFANGIILPGMAFEDEDLDVARAAVPQTAAVYQEQVEGVAAHVAGFVELVARHFERATGPDLDMAAAAARA